MEQTIPVVDLSHFDDPSKREAFIKTLGDSLERLGFVAVENHGIDQDLFDRTYSVYRRFFARDEAEKKKADLSTTAKA